MLDAGARVWSSGGALQVLRGDQPSDSLTAGFLASGLVKSSRHPKQRARTPLETQASKPPPAPELPSSSVAAAAQPPNSQALPSPPFWPAAPDSVRVPSARGTLAGCTSVIREAPLALSAERCGPPPSAEVDRVHDSMVPVAAGLAVQLGTQLRRRRWSSEPGAPSRGPWSGSGSARPAR